MMPRPLLTKQRERGATLVVALIMLVLMMLMVTSAFMMSTTNLKAVGNEQFRAEATAAANKAIEQVLSSAFADAPTADEIGVDIDNDDTDDYTVNIAVPQCIRSIENAVSAAGRGSSTELGIAPPAATYNTLWEIDATVSDPASGASVRIRQGVMVRLDQTQYDAVCALPAP